MSAINAAVSFVAGIFEFFIGFFIGATHTISFVDLLGLLFVFMCECVFWLILWCFELIVSLCKFRKPKRVKKPIFWRPTLKPKKLHND